MLKLSGVTKKYPTKNGEKIVLENLNLNLDNKGLVCVLGSSGCGKTTLLNLIGGLDGDFSGEILFGGNNLSCFSMQELDEYRNSQVGFVFQNSYLIGNMTIRENVQLSLKLARQKDLSAVDTILEKMGVLDLADKYPHEISGGERQRVSIARAIINQPSIILADEPTGALDLQNSRAVMSHLKELSKECLVVVVTHNDKLAEEFADRILRLENGTMVYDSCTCDAQTDERYSPRKTGGLNAFSALQVSFRNLWSQKMRTALVTIVQLVSVFAICLVLTLSSWFMYFVNDTERNLHYTYPVTAGQSLNYMDIFNSVTTDDAKEILANNQVHLDKTILNLYQSVSTLFELDEAYMDYIAQLDNGLYAFTNYNYGYNFHANFFTKIDDDMPFVTSVDYILNQFAENDDTVSAFFQYANPFNVLPSNYQSLIDGCDVIGQLPTGKNDLVLIIDKDGFIADYVMAMLGFYSSNELKDIFSGQTTEFKSDWDYDEIRARKYYFLNNDTVYKKGVTGYSKNSFYSVGSSTNQVDLQISCIIKQSSDEKILLRPGVYYHSQLEEYMFEQAKTSNIYNDMKNRLENYSTFTNPFGYGSMTKQEYGKLFRSVGGATNPVTIQFYTDSLQNKQEILNYLDDWNTTHQDSKVAYNDGFSSLMDVVGNLVDEFMSFVKIVAIIAFVLVMVMTGIIALERSRQRTTEFGIMRCIGASRKNITQIICFEYGLVGIVAGILGVGLSYVAALLYFVIVGATVYTFVPVYLGVAIAVAVCAFNLLCAIIPSSIILKNNPIKSIRQ